MNEKIQQVLGLLQDEATPEPPAGTLSAAELAEIRQLAVLFEELDREFGESDDPDLRFAMAFARQCAMGELSD